MARKLFKTRISNFLLSNILTTRIKTKEILFLAFQPNCSGKSHQKGPRFFELQYLGKQTWSKIVYATKSKSGLRVGICPNSTIPVIGTEMKDFLTISKEMSLNENELYLHMRVWCTVGLSWKTWLLTARLCSSLNGGKMIPSLTGNVSLNSSSSAKRNQICFLAKYIIFALIVVWSSSKLLLWLLKIIFDHNYNKYCVNVLFFNSSF